MLSDHFKLADEPAARPSQARGYARNGAFMVFEGAAEILAVAQFLYPMGEKQPPLVIETHSGIREGAYIYEGAKIDSIVHEVHQIRINTNLGQLFIGEKSDDPNRHCIDNIQVLPEYFPFNEYWHFREQKRLHGWSWRPETTYSQPAAQPLAIPD